MMHNKRDVSNDVPFIIVESVANILISDAYLVACSESLAFLYTKTKNISTLKTCLPFAS